ncbi:MULTISPECIES: TetR/AcrR family transcriptional regulator [Amycolatopsis]|uniref:TetR/AcrR family transcriptional regulator n=1 Tax=Amycolatopsis TaxID=1813 RepID=UPI0007E05115|nr:helix-turn-helix domain-containing protein [Amycolatopsis sp. M39]OAP20022.1 Bacterial regulatory protein, tetR family [Amycolatopsis sp. M39]
MTRNGPVSRVDRASTTLAASRGEVTSEEGLDGVTIGRLADELEMSKSGVHKHFGTKETLRISTLDKAWTSGIGWSGRRCRSRPDCGGCART